MKACSNSHRKLKLSTILLTRFTVKWATEIWATEKWATEKWATGKMGNGNLGNHLGIMGNGK